MDTADNIHNTEQPAMTGGQSAESPTPNEVSTVHATPTIVLGHDSLTVLQEIRDLLNTRLPETQSNKPWWQPRKWLIWVTVLLVALFFLDFPSDSRSRADLVVLNGTELSIVKLPEPDWNVVGVRPSPEYWRVPNPQVNVTSLWEFSLFRQGRRYKPSTIRVIRREGEPSIDLSSPPVRILGPTTIMLNPISKLEGDERLIATRIVRTHALKANNQIVPFLQLIDSTNYSGKLVVETKPRIGWERFKSNPSMAFGLLK